MEVETKNQTKNNFKKKIHKLLLYVVGGIIICGFLAYYFFLVPNVLETKRIYIYNGSTYRKILSQFNDDKVLKNTTTFSIASGILGCNGIIKRGSYILNRGMNNWQLISLMKRGLQKPLKFTISYAIDKNNFIEQVCSKLDITQQQLRTILEDSEELSKYGFNSENVLAMFIPNTYELYWTISGKEFVQKMYKEYKSFWNETRIQKAKNLKLSPIEISILASLVQSETNKIDEAPRIAGVYVNRLNKKIPLCSCPTIKYIIDDKSIRRILKKDILIKSEYNTYKKTGLPPGSICMPNIAYIDAVLNFEEHRYLYFSTREDLSGYHYFAKTLQEHSNNARRYRNALNKKKVFR